MRHAVGAVPQRLSSLLSASGSSGSGSASPPLPVPDGWQLWGWDPRRGCRALRRSSEHQSGAWQGSWALTSDVPCSWGLAFVCTEATAEGGGDGGQGTSSSAWYRRWLEASASQPSPYRLGPGASGLRLVSSGALLTPPCHPCMPCAMVPPNTDITRCFDYYGWDWYDRPVVSFNDSELFWQQGPITSMLVRWGRVGCVRGARGQQLQDCTAVHGFGEQHDVGRVAELEGVQACASLGVHGQGRVHPNGQLHGT